MATALLCNRMGSNAEQTNQATTRKDAKGNYIIGYTSPILNVVARSIKKEFCFEKSGPKFKVIESPYHTLN